MINLFLATPKLNRHDKKDKDTADWLPPQNQYWFAAQAIKVEKKYSLSIDRSEKYALIGALCDCDEEYQEIE